MNQGHQLVIMLLVNTALCTTCTYPWLQSWWPNTLKALRRHLYIWVPVCEIQASKGVLSVDMSQQAETHSTMVRTSARLRCTDAMLR